MKIKNISCAVVATAVLLAFSACEPKENKGTAPTVTDSVMFVGSAHAYCKATITDNGSEKVTKYGFCYGTQTLPTIENTKVEFTYEDFITDLSSLTPNTTYYLRSYATSSVGTSYGNEVTFTTLSRVKDNEGNEYSIRQFGDQIWIIDNLKTRHYNNNDTIATTYPTNKDIRWETQQNYQWPCEGKESNVPAYGRLYTWFAANDIRGIAPKGYHLPSKAECEKLASIYLNNNYGKLSKFTPSGSRYGENYSGKNEGTVCWSSSLKTVNLAYSLYISIEENTITVSEGSFNNGYTVFCVKDK